LTYDVMRFESIGIMSSEYLGYGPSVKDRIMALERS
jgi:hypothetical protein